jgi:hypothetical protein
MANIKISQLPAKGANLASTDLVEISEFNGSGYVSKSITGQEIIDGASGGGVTDVTATAPLSSTGGSTPDIAITQAGAADDGYLSTGDWNAFNNKQDGLISGTNIKSLNGASLLGSGGLSVQPTLVSGTNIKTINGSDILGSGDLVVGGGLQGYYNFIKPQAGQTVNNRFITTSSSFNIYTNNIIRLHPYVTAYTITSTTISIQVLTGQAGALGRILIYSNLNGLPNTKLYESADLNLSTSGFKTATIAFTFTAGTTYWIGFQNFLTVTSASITSILNGSMIQFLANPTTNGGYTGYETSAYTFGTAPATMGAVTGTDQSFPLILIKL